jgi:hypothetical protein
MRETFTSKRTASGIALSAFVIVFFYVSTAEAQYIPLVGLPQVQGSGQGLAGYFNQLYMVTIAVGAILAFIKISIAGVKWSLSDVVTDKSSAKNDIRGALLGLAILLIPFIVLNTIYPGLTSLNILQNATSVKITPPAASDTGQTYGQPISVTPDTPTTPPPNMQCNGVDYIACASATDCSAARTRCNTYQTRCLSPQQIVNANITSSVPQGATMIICTYRTNNNATP